MTARSIDPAADWTAGVPRLLLRSCDQCGRYRYLPSERCETCGSREVTPVPAAGSGLCVARTRLAARGDAAEPVVLVLVELDEGPVAMGRADPGVAPGDRVHVRFGSLPAAGPLVPFFSGEDRP